MDIFVASPNELRAAFPQRVPPKSTPLERTVRNPLTGEPMVYREWLPAQPFPVSEMKADCPNSFEHESVRKLPHAEINGIDFSSLTSLGRLLGLADEHVTEIGADRPALVAPIDTEDEIYVLSPAWIRFLVAVEDPEALAQQWIKEKGGPGRKSAKRAERALSKLCELAKRAVAESKDVYVWVDLR